MLLSNKFKPIGWILFIPSFILGSIIMFFDFGLSTLRTKTFVFYAENTLTDITYFGIAEVEIFHTIVAVVFIVSSLFIGFSKEKVEDEYIKSLRLTSLQWAVMVNYILLIVAFVFVYGMRFIDIMMINMYTVLVFYIARFNILLYVNSKKLKNEE